MSQTLWTAVTYLIVCWWWLRLEGFVPPPVGTLPGGPGARRDSGRGKIRRTRKRSGAEPPPAAVGDDEIVCGSGDGDDAAVVQPVVIWADQHQVGQLSGAAVFPVPDMMCVQTAGGTTARHRACRTTVLERAANPPADLAGRSAGADDLAGTFEPHFTGGIASQVLPFGVGEQRTQMQRRGTLLNVDMHDHRGVMAVWPASGLGVPSSLDQAHKRLDRAGQRGSLF